MGHFYRVPEEVFKSDISANAKLLYAYLLNLDSVSKANGNTFTWASANTIAKAMKVSQSTAKRLLYELERNGLLHIERRNGKTSKMYLHLFNSDTTTRVKNDTTTRIKNDTPLSLVINNELDKGSYSRKQKNHVASYDSKLYREKAQTVPEYQKKKEV